VIREIKLGSIAIFFFSKHKNPKFLRRVSTEPEVYLIPFFNYQREYGRHSQKVHRDEEMLGITCM